MEAQHAREVEAWDMSCRIMFRMMLAYRRICARRNTSEQVLPVPPRGSQYDQAITRGLAGLDTR